MTRDTRLDSEEARIEQLLKEAGPRLEPPLDLMNEVRGAVYKEWQAETRHHTSIKSWLAIAATLLLAVAAGLWQFGLQEETVLARMDRSTGVVELSLDNQAWVPVVLQAVKETEFTQNMYLRTRQLSRLSITLVSGVNIRLDIDTTIQIQSLQAIVLLDGAIYVDSGRHGSADSRIQIITRLGNATDLGTQFEVRLDQDAVQVRVREGIVNFSAPDTVYRTESGTSVELDNAGVATRGGTPAYDRSWAWVQSVAPQFTIDNHSLMDFLKWAARETGAELEFENAFAEATARRTILHGEMSGFTVEESLLAILATTDLEQVSAQPGVLLVRLKH
ncbi:MAG: FecR family protein [Gammaproteobacteria bacterium]|nr:FecR family protein [Gammaproteobacteria bacterium]